MKKDIRNDFPILTKKMNGHPLIYFDSASTTQKPQVVIDSLVNFYREENANVHRGIYQLSEQATESYENARAKIARFINADSDEIIFTRGTTESINLIASTWASENLQENDEIVLSELEHHSNLLPWIWLSLKNKVQLKYIPVLADGRLDIQQIPQIITRNCKIVSILHVSNAIGSHVGIKDIIDFAHSRGALVLIDAAQSIAHQPIDVKKMDCDFLAFSGHKLLGPTGIGVLYIKKELHEQISPYQFGGGMVYQADFYHAIWRQVPARFEAGTPAIAQAIGLGTAVEYIQNNIDWHQLRVHEAQLCDALIDGLSEISSIKLIGPLDELKKVGHLVSFTVDGIHPHDVAAFLDRFGICVRAGHQCAQPLAQKLGLDSSVRASFYAYNTMQEVEQFIKIMNQLHQTL